MIRKSLCVILIAVVVHSTPGALGLDVQAPGREEPAPSTQIEVNAVLLDVVVTDRKGKRISGIPREEFEVFEDGVRQHVQSLEETSPPDSVPSASALPPLADRGTEAAPAIVALVFDRLSPAGRKSARDAALSYLKRLPNGHSVSVMSIDRTLRVLTPFTRDVERLALALEAVAGSLPGQFDDLDEKVRESIRRERQSYDDAMQVQETGKGGLYSEAKLNQVLTDMMRQAATAENAVQGFSSLDSLMEIVDSTRALPGRKAVVFFAESLRVPLQALDRHRDLISAANRVNVSIYCIDPSGLGNSPQLEQVGSGLQSLAQTNEIARRRTEGMSDKSIRREEVMMGETAENTIRTPTSSTLAGLAEPTGGLVVADTNDLEAGLAAVSDDLREHYELSYTPTNGKYDGSFRKIQVKVGRPGVQVRARSGYYAVPAGIAAVRTFEIPMLNSLSAPSLPSDFAFYAEPLIFPTSGANSSVVLAVEVPLTGFTLVEESPKKTRATLQLLLLMTDGQGQIVDKMSREFPLEGGKDLKNVSFYYHGIAEVPAGHYSLKAAVRDPVSGKTAAKMTSFEVQPSRGFSASSVVIVHGLDSVGPADDLLEDPLQIGQQMVIPLLSSNLTPGVGKGLPFFFTVRFPSGGQESATYQLTITREGKPVATSGEQKVPTPDTHGISRCSMTLPLDGFPPGSYDAQILVGCAGQTQKASVSFDVQTGQ